MIWTALGAAWALLLIVPDSAWAWGPITHLYHASEAVRQATNLPAHLQQLLETFRWEYLYGCIAADIVQVKRYTRSIYTHCHNWRIGWQMLDEANSAPERAFAQGYLAHLASDTYSHNYFVPAQLVVSFPSNAHRHVYWEARFDANLEETHRDLLVGVSERTFPECDDLVERVVGRTLFSFRTNKRIFRSMVTLQRLHQWQTTLRRVTALSRFTLSPPAMEHYNGLCIAAIRDLLAHGGGADVLRHDPNGHETLRRANEVRRKLRVLRRRRVPIEALQRSFVASLRDGRHFEDFFSPPDA